jgi:hypothetical protein
MSNEKVEKMLKGQSSKEIEYDSEPDVTLNKGNRRKKYIMSISNKKRLVISKWTSCIGG